jgi:hypothetical protein
MQDSAIHTQGNSFMDQIYSSGMDGKWSFTKREHPLNFNGFTLTIQHKDAEQKQSFAVGLIFDTDGIDVAIGGADMTANDVLDMRIKGPEEFPENPTAAPVACLFLEWEELNAQLVAPAQVDPLYFSGEPGTMNIMLKGENLGEPRVLAKIETSASGISVAFPDPMARQEAAVIDFIEVEHGEPVPVPTRMRFGLK